MNGVIVYSGKRGSTKQYAQWIGDATGLPVFDVSNAKVDPADYDFLILGSSVIFMKMTIRKWVQANWDEIKQKPTLLFSVSGVTADDPLLQNWLRASYPDELVERSPHFGLGGRLDLSKFSWWMRLFMRIGAYTKPTPEKKRDMLEGFDRVDKAASLRSSNGPTQTKRKPPPLKPHKSHSMNAMKILVYGETALAMEHQDRSRFSRA